MIYKRINLKLLKSKVLNVRMCGGREYPSDGTLFTTSCICVGPAPGYPSDVLLVFDPPHEAWGER